MELSKHFNKIYGPEHDKEEIMELILDNLKIGELKEADKKILESYVETVLLSMNFCGLKNLNNLPNLPKLEIVRFIFNF